MIETLKSLCQDAGIELSPKLLEQFAAYHHILDETGRVMNLTAIKAPEEVALKHFFDCLTALRELSIPEGARVIDVGTGAGFPGLVLAALRPDVTVTLLDSVRKKLTFCEQAAAGMGLLNVETRHMRAEDAGREGTLRQAFDVALARAVAPMEELCELCLPLVKRGGFLAAMKGPGLSEELAMAAGMIRTLGGGVEREIAIALPGQEGRWVAVVRKVSPTPPEYPRRPGKKRGR